MNKTEPGNATNSEETISICDVMKTNTSKVIKKFESQVPVGIQQYSDLYSTFLHTLDDVYGTCYVSEKEFFDQLDLDPKILKSFQEFSKSYSDFWIDQIDLYAKYKGELIKTQISYLQTYDSFMHVLMDSYAKTLAQLNTMNG